MVYRYEHPELFADWEKPDFKQYSGNLVLWGAGKIGGMAAHCLKQRGVEFLAFCDIAKDKWGTDFCGHKVISPEDLKRDYSDAVIIISNVFHNSIFSQLIDEGFTKIFSCTSLFMEIDFDGYNFWMAKDYAIRNTEQYLAAILEQKTEDGTVDQIFLDITTRCTLRCKECSSFIPYVSSPCDYEPNIILEDFNKVLDILKHIRIVNFSGGEPFLHPELPIMIRSLARETRIDRISAITNGTVTPNGELIAAMKAEKRFLLRISDYGNISTKLSELRVILDTNDIKYEIANYPYWDRTSRIGKANWTEKELVAKFRHCTACNVLKIQNRKLCFCSTGTTLYNIGIFPNYEDNCVDLSKRELQQSVLDYVRRPITGKYLDACRYCSGNHCTQFENKIPVAEQATGELTPLKLF